MGNVCEICRKWFLDDTGGNICEKCRPEIKKFITPTTFNREELEEATKRRRKLVEDHNS